MAVAEKANFWLTNTQKSLKHSQPDYKGSKLKLKSEDWNYSEDKRRIRDENNLENLLFFKSPKGRKYGQKDCYRYRATSRDVDLEATFTSLVNQWREENRGVSSTNQMSMHPAYQQIIGMGKPVIPLLLRELEKKSGHWFWALKSISREDPVPPEYRGKVKEMTKAWLEWGRQRGYRW
ncbi:hypothetical protein [Nostoc sp.]|uniref:hypothetical protein n=1 Tax=Nostoc sp. TaxID=1180 RepID=UPI002FFBA4FF